MEENKTSLICAVDTIYNKRKKIITKQVKVTNKCAFFFVQFFKCKTMPAER